MTSRNRDTHPAMIPVAFVLALSCWLWPGATRAQESPGAATVAQGRVVQVTASEVFVDIGAEQGVSIGHTISVMVGRQPVDLPVLDTWRSGSRCRLGADQPIPRLGASASHRSPAQPRTGQEPPAKRPKKKPVRRLAKPAPMDALRPLWAGIARSRAALVRYGDTDQRPGNRPGPERDRTHGLLAFEYSGLLDPRADALERQYHQVALRSDLHVPALLDGRLTYSHHVRLRQDIAPDIDTRAFREARTALRIYQMRAALTLGATVVALGRTAAGPLPQAGAIDGASLRRHIGPGLSVGAWAGASPGMVDLWPSPDALAFGAYASWRHEFEQRPQTRIALDGGILGSVWQGALDRRALALRASFIEPDRWAHAQLVLDAGAPTRPVVEPSLAFLDLGWRILEHLRASVRFDHVRALRTQEALATLPSRYLSTVAFTSVRAGADLSIRRGLGVSARAGWRVSAEGAGNLWTSASVRASGLFFGNDRFTLGVDGALGTRVDGAAVRLGYSLPVHRRLDIATGYRLYGYRYGEENERLFTHHPSLGISAALPWRVYLDMDIDAYLGAEETVLGLFTSAARRF